MSWLGSRRWRRRWGSTRCWWGSPARAAGAGRRSPTAAASRRTGAIFPAPAGRARGSPGGAPPARDFWYPGGVAAYGCLRWGGRVAPFFVAWDRAGTPAWQRRNLLRRWARFRFSENPWGPGGLPPVVIAAAGGAELAQWRDAARWRESRAGEPLPLVLATVPELASAGPGGAIWRTPSDPRRAPLARRLGWRLRGSLPPASRPVAWPAGTAALPRREAAPSPPLRSRVRLPGRRRLGARSRRERIALVSLATDREEKRLVEYVGRNPLLDEAQLAALLDLPQAATRRRLERLLRLGVIAPLSRRAAGDDGGEPPPRFLLSTAGLRWLAARDRVPFSVYACYGAAIALSDGGTRPTRPSRAYRDFEHTLGLNRALVRFAVDARATGARLQAWHPDAASERRFVLADGRSARICPDGAGVLVRGPETCSFLLEYDRGTLDVGRYRQKLLGYRAYFSQEGWRADFPSRPLLLFACARYRGDEIVVRAAERWSPGRELLLAPEWRYKSGRDGGILGPVWRRKPGPELDGTLFQWNAVLGGRGGDASGGESPPPMRAPVSAGFAHRRATAGSGRRSRPERSG